MASHCNQQHESTRRTNDEESSESGAEHLVVLVGHQYAVRSGDGLGSVRNEGDVQLADSTVRARGARPSQVGVVRVSGDRQDLCVDGGELGAFLAERYDLSLHDNRLRLIRGQHTFQREIF